MKVKPSFLVSVNTCTVTLCDTSNWWSDVSGNLSDSIKSNELKLKRNNLGFRVNIFKWYNCQTLKWLQICGEKVAYGEVLLWMNFSKKKKHNVQSTAGPTGTWLTSGASITNPVQALTITFFVLCFHILKCYFFFLTVW